MLFADILFAVLLCAPSITFALPNAQSPTSPPPQPIPQAQKCLKNGNPLPPKITSWTNSWVEYWRPNWCPKPEPPEKPKWRANREDPVVIRFNISTLDEQNEILEAVSWMTSDLWSLTPHRADIRMDRAKTPHFLRRLPKHMHSKWTYLYENLDEAVRNSTPPANKSSFILPASDGGMSIFEEYQPLPVLVQWMKLLAEMFPTHVRMISIGKTSEGRDIHALKVGVVPSTVLSFQDSRKTIIVSGGSHAREWISVSTVAYVAWNMIISYKESPGIGKLLQEFDFVFIPTLNPDGYVYTWENDRLWRKNRQRVSPRDDCIGIDLDRAFGYEWDTRWLPQKQYECHENYQGERPFHATEALSLAEWAKFETADNDVRFVGFLDFHAYSQQVLYPYSYSCSADPPSLENLEELAFGIAKAIRLSSGEQYDVASACEGAISSKDAAAEQGISRTDSGGGSAIDWFYHEMRVRNSYQIKLRDQGSYGFLLPKENIIPTGDEAFNAVKFFGDFLLGNKGIEKAEERLFPEVHHDELELKFTIQ